MAPLEVLLLFWIPGGPGAQQGTDAILIQDNETKQNRMYGYIIMASSVVVLAILMVIFLQP